CAFTGGATCMNALRRAGGDDVGNPLDLPRQAELAPEHIRGPARPDPEPDVRADQTLQGFVDGAVSARNDDVAKAFVRSFASKARRIVRAQRRTDFNLN